MTLDEDFLFRDVEVVENGESPVDTEEAGLRGDWGEAEAEVTGGSPAVGGAAGDGVTGSRDGVEFPGEEN
ncbi:hypothetical protein AALO_G00268440, partial [Alosa alosa]